jgi:hypothetical protein
MVAKNVGCNNMRVAQCVSNGEPPCDRANGFQNLQIPLENRLGFQFPTRFTYRALRENFPVSRLAVSFR